MTVAITELSLLDLPDDLLQLILSTRHLPRTSLVEFACVSKTAAQVALPALYTNLLVPSITALPLLYSTLCARPELANHVRSVTASRYFLASFKLSDSQEKELQRARTMVGSPIVSVTKISSLFRGDVDALMNELPMPWLARIACVCPQLAAVDINDLDELSLRARFLLLGLADVAAILQDRRGRLTCRSWPFACVLVKDRWVMPTDVPSGAARFVPDVYFVESVDWGCKQIHVTDFLGSDPALGTDFCFVPFRDLVPLDDQASWSIGDAELLNHSIKYDADRENRWIGTKWLQSEHDLWLNAGLRKGQDHVYDFSHPELLKGTITLALPMIDLVDDVPNSLRAHTYKQCTRVIIDGANTEDKDNHPVEEQEQILAMTMHIFSTIPDRPLSFVTWLRFTSAFFIEHGTVSHMMHVLAEGVPNLEHLSLLNADCPLDYILNHADALVRRSLFPGTLLRELHVSSCIPHPNASRGIRFVSSPLNWTLAGTHRPRSPLGHGHPASELRVLDLALIGSGVDMRNAFNAATVVIHPGILRHVRTLRLESVQLFLPPAHLAQPDSPSFMPLNHMGSSAAVPLTHAFTLPHLEQLSLTSNALGALRPLLSKSRFPLSTVLHSVPHTPALLQLFFSVDVMHEAKNQFSTAVVAPLMRRCPRLEFARFQYVASSGVSKDQVERAILDEFFAPYPRELAPCPRLRAVVINRQKHLEYFGWRSKKDGWLERAQKAGKGSSFTLKPLAVDL